MNRPRNGIRNAALLAAVAVLAAATGAAPTVDSIPLNPHGGTFGNSMGAPVPLTPTSLLIPVLGPDGTSTTVDDLVLLVSDVVGTPVVTPLATPYLAGPSGRVVRLSATRAVTTGAGADGAFGSADDVLFVLDGVGSASQSVASVVVGFLHDSNYSSATALTADSVVVASRGPDGVANSADDRVTLVTDVAGTPVATHLAAPFLENSGRTRPVALSPDSFLVASNGPDAGSASADSVGYFFSAVGGADDRDDVSVPFLVYGTPGRPVRVTDDRALVGTAGPDGSVSNADDVVVLLDKLGTANQTDDIAVPHLPDYAAGTLVVLSRDSAAVTTEGPDSTDYSADDTVAILTRLGSQNDVTQVTVGATDEDSECRVVRMAPDRLAVLTFGADNTNDGADDEMAFVDDVGGTNAVSHVVVGAVHGRVCSEPRCFDRSTIALTTGGGDNDIGSGLDDVITVVSGVGGTPVVDAVAVLGDANDSTAMAFVPQPLGAGRAAFVSNGADNTLGTGNDDLVRIVEGLPSARTLFVKKATLKFKAASPEKGEKASFSGNLFLDGENLFGESDVTVSIGNASQTIPAKDFTEKNGNWTYSDPKGLKGFVQKVSFKWKKSSFSVKAKGIGTGIEGTGAAYVPVAVEAGHLYLSASLAGTAFSGGIKYKAPKE